MNMNGKREREGEASANPSNQYQSRNQQLESPIHSLTSTSNPVMATSSSSSSASTSNPTSKPKAALHPNPDAGCPLCPSKLASSINNASMPSADHVHYTLESWIGCSKCKIWYHTSCTNADPEDYLKWYCQSCITQSQSESRISASNPDDPKGKKKQVKPLANVLKPAQRKSGRKREKIDYQRIQEGLPPDPVGRWKRLFEERSFAKDQFKRMDPKDWTLDWLLKDPNAMESPVMIPSDERRERERAEQKEERELQRRTGSGKVGKKKTGKNRWYGVDEEEKGGQELGGSAREEQIKKEEDPSSEARPEHPSHPLPSKEETGSNNPLNSSHQQTVREEPTLENSIASSSSISSPNQSSVTSSASNSTRTLASDQQLPQSYSYQDFTLALASSAIFAQSQMKLQASSTPIQPLPLPRPPVQPQLVDGRPHPLLEPYLNPSQPFCHPQWNDFQHPYQFQHPSQFPSSQAYHQAPTSTNPTSHTSTSVGDDSVPKGAQFPERPVHVPPTFEQLEALSSSIYPVDASQAHPSTSSSADVIRDRPILPRKMKIPGMTMPPQDMTIREVALLVGEHTPVEVIDVATQSSSKSWTLGSWATYFSTPSHLKRKILNVISLEVTNSPMEPLVEAPDLVRQLCWVTRDWPGNKRDKNSKVHSWPKVQRYCLMGVEGAYTDFHIDFCASAVYYHVMWGQKTFLLAPPTQQNLKAYQAWSSSTRQDLDWLGDNLDQLTRVDVLPGDTLLIASGWIHAVYTPKDTLVLGGNWISDWSISRQWRVAEIEKITKVPRKFRFPHIERLSWYVASGWLRRFAEQEKSRNVEKVRRYQRIEIPSFPPERVLRGLLLLCDKLDSELSVINNDEAAQAQVTMPLLENGKPQETDVAQLNKSKERLKRMARESIPPEIGRVGTHHSIGNGVETESGEVGGAEGVARELRERVERRLDELVVGWRDAKVESKGRGRWGRS